MQQPEIDKIKQLVKISSLLSPAEKEEWLVLTDLMNDKQLWELRKILETAEPVSSIKYQVSSQDGKPVESQEIRGPVVLSKQPEKPKPAMIPPLTHIVNLPKAGTAVFPKGVSSIKYQVSGKEEEKKAGFWKKIKEVLAEKELPPGHKEPAEELELPGPLQAQSAKRKAQSEEDIEPRVLPKKPPIVPKPPLAPEPLQQKQGISSTIEQAIPKQAEQKKEIEVGTLRVSKLILSPASESPEALQRAEKRAYESLAPAAEPESRLEERLKDKLEEKQASDFGAELIQALHGPEIKEPKEAAGEVGKPKAGPEDKLFVAGLKDAGILMGAKLREKPREAEETAKEAKHIKELPVAKINTLEQVSKLSVRDLINNLAPPLRNLTGSLGYHKLVQALEKSPLFSIYINTGLAALSGKYDLDTGEYKTKTMERFLAKEEFERFADVLRAIKN